MARRTPSDALSPLDSMPAMASIGCAVLGLVAVLVILIGTLATVDAGHVGVVTQGGATTGTILKPGWNFKMPLLQGIEHFDLRTVRGDTEASAATKDLQDVQAKIAINYRLDGSVVVNVYNTLGKDYANRVLSPAIQEAFKATTANFTAGELITRREEVKVKARELLKDRMERFGIIIEEINIVDLDFSPTFNAAIEAANTQRQRVIEAEQKLRQVEVEAQQQVAQAKAAAEATRARADAEAYQTLTKAKAEAEAQRLQVQALSPLYVEYIRWTKWNGAFPTTVLSNDGNILYGINR